MGFFLLPSNECYFKYCPHDLIDILTIDAILAPNSQFNVYILRQADIRLDNFYTFKIGTCSLKGLQNCSNKLNAVVLPITLFTA